MQLEEREVLPAARGALLPGQWQAIAEAFALNHDPLAGPVPQAQEFRALRESILDALPDPLGYGSSS
jgi:hypothetical protein